MTPWLLYCRAIFIEILRETPSFRAGRKGDGPCGATAEPSGGVEAPAFRPGRTSTRQVMNPKQLEFPLERRDTFIVCPRCQRCCSRVQDSRPRCIRDLPILER